jgi:hypothetical protein
MKNFLLIATALLLLTSSADALNNDTVKEQLYRLNGKTTVRIWTDSNGDVEFRLVPGWQLACPESKWGEHDCNGSSQGYLTFVGSWSKNFLNGDARLDGLNGCDENWFRASIRRTRNGSLVLSAIDGPTKCRAVFKPTR